MSLPAARAVVRVTDLAGTVALGRRLGARLFAGAVVALDGPLGAGKTHLTRAIAEGLGVPDPSVVTSPTFVLIQEYTGGRMPVYHFDTYRLSDAGAFLDTGAAEYLGGNGVCVVEWAGRVGDVLPPERLSVRITRDSEDGRTFELSATGAGYVGVVEGL